MEEESKLQANNPLPEALAESAEAKIKAQKELVETIMVQWKLLWSERFNDKIRAEDVSLKDYSVLNVERGTVIHANRDFKTITFKEILEQHLVGNPDRFVHPDAQIGGWGKFVKTKITNSQPRKNQHSLPCADKKQDTNQPKKSARGWLHVT